MNTTQRAAWTDRPYFSFDAETTSANPLIAHYVTASLVKMHNGEVLDQRNWTINPAVEIEAEAVEIHGMSNEWAAQHGADPAVALGEIIKMLAAVLNSGTPLVIYNAAYDLTSLEKQAEFHNISGLRELVHHDKWNRVIDPFVSAKGYETYWLHEYVKGRTYKLPAVCERWGVKFEESHDAWADAVGAGRLARVLYNDDADLAKKGPEQLHRLQKKWRERIQDSLRSHFDKNEIDHDGVDAGWPLHSSLTGA